MSRLNELESLIEHFHAGENTFAGWHDPHYALRSDQAPSMLAAAVSIASEFGYSGVRRLKPIAQLNSFDIYQSRDLRPVLMGLERAVERGRREQANNESRRPGDLCNVLTLTDLQTLADSILDMRREALAAPETGQPTIRLPSEQKAWRAMSRLCRQLDERHRYGEAGRIRQLVEDFTLLSKRRPLDPGFGLMGASIADDILNWPLGDPTATVAESAESRREVTALPTAKVTELIISNLGSGVVQSEPDTASWLVKHNVKGYSRDEWRAAFKSEPPPMRGNPRFYPAEEVMRELIAAAEMLKQAVGVVEERKQVAADMKPESFDADHDNC